MRKILFVILLGFGLVNTGLAQQYFNIRDAMHGIGTILTSVVPHNGKYYMTGLTTDSSNYIGNNQFANVEGVKFAVFDSMGNKLIDTVYQKVYLQAMEPWSTSSLYPMPDGNFILACQYLDTTKWSALILKFDSLGHLLSEREYAQPFCNTNDWYDVVDFKPLSTGEWLLLGTLYCDVNATTHYNNMVLTKLDSSFNVIWSKQFGTPPNNHIPKKIFIDTDGYILAGGMNNQNLVGSGFTFRPELIKIDTSGTIKWDWIRPTGYGYAANDVIRSADGGYIYCGTGAGFEDFEPNFKGWVEKLDSGRNSVWYKAFNQYYYTTQFKFVKELPSGDVLLFGDKYCPVRLDSVNVNLHTRGWYLLLNNNGDSLVEHNYYYMRTCEDYNKIYDVKQTSDGGYIMVGESTDQCGGAQWPTQRGWIVKIDSNGCINPVFCDQQDTSTEVRPSAALRASVVVRPNPARDILQISWDGIYQGEISVLDITGRLLIQMQLSHSMDVSKLASGLYIYRVTEKGIVRAQGKFVKE